jgi:hypothetical protein
MTGLASTLHEDQYTFLIISRSVLRNFSDQSCRENQNSFTFNNVFPKIVPFISQRGKYSRAGQVTDDSMTHARCMLPN